MKQCSNAPRIQGRCSNQKYVSMYSARQKNGSQVARIIQARPGRSGKQQLEQNTLNLGTVFLPGPVHAQLRTTQTSRPHSFPHRMMFEKWWRGSCSLGARWGMGCDAVLWVHEWKYNRRVSSLQWGWGRGESMMQHVANVYPPLTSTAKKAAHKASFTTSKQLVLSDNNRFNRTWGSTVVVSCEQVSYITQGAFTALVSGDSTCFIFLSSL